MSTEGEFQCANQLIAAVHDFKIGVNIKCQVTTLPHSIKKKVQTWNRGEGLTLFSLLLTINMYITTVFVGKSYFLNWKVFLIF